MRYFKERRLAVQFVDLRRKPIAAGELRRFVERLGAVALADTGGRAWRDAGLGYLRMTSDELAGRLLADQRLLRLPLVRIGNGFAAGRDEAAWQQLLATP
ncbi:MAG: arsenate reductase [Chloroflexi bacterium]|nr:arsenate reductase [Chloroflexota bacterium]